MPRAPGTRVAPVDVARASVLASIQRCAELLTSTWRSFADERNPNPDNGDRTPRHRRRLAGGCRTRLVDLADRGRRREPCVGTEVSRFPAGRGNEARTRCADRHAAAGAASTVRGCRAFSRWCNRGHAGTAPPCPNPRAVHHTSGHCDDDHGRVEIVKVDYLVAGAGPGGLRVAADLSQALRDAGVRPRDMSFAVVDKRCVSTRSRAAIAHTFEAPCCLPPPPAGAA